VAEQDPHDENVVRHDLDLGLKLLALASSAWLLLALYLVLSPDSVQGAANCQLTGDSGQVQATI
jgi:hypothetical protein